MKKTIALMIAMMLMLVSVTAFAGTEITVVGTGETQVSADTAVIFLGVSARDRDVMKAQQKVNETIAAIRTALTEAGVEEENINTNYINIYAIYGGSYDSFGSGEQEEVTAYSAGSSLAVKVTDMEKVGLLIDEAFAAGANTLDGISFSASSTENASAESLKLASADARKKAEILAEASGLHITGIEKITEGYVNSYENTVGNFSAKNADTAAEAAYGAGTVVQAARVIVSVSVTVTFEAE